MIEPKDILTWDYLLPKVKLDLEIQNEVDIHVNEVYEGWKFLSEFYGNKGLKILAHHDLLGQTLLNGAPWARIYVGHIGSMIEHASQRMDFQYVKSRLLMPDQFASALFEVKVAYQLDLEEIENRYMATSSVPSADIEANIDGQVVRIEVHRQRAPRTPLVGPFEMFSHDFHTKLDSSGVEYAGIIYTRFSKNHLAEILEKLRKAFKKAQNENRLIEVVEDWIPFPKAKFAIVPNSLKDDLTAWKIEHDLDPQTTLSFPGIEMDLGRRVIRSIAHKLKQIPDDAPGVMVIEGVNFLFSFDTDTSKPKATSESWDALSRIEEFVFDSPRLAYVVLIGGHMGPAYPTRKYNFDPIWISTRERSHMLYDDTVIIRNRFSVHHGLSKIVDVFA